MPKKMGTNTKAVEAKAKKDEKKRMENDAKAKEKEDALWVDDDKNVNKKAQRKEEKEEKRTQQLEKKKELQALADKEMNEVVPKKEATSKMTHYQLAQMKELPKDSRKVNAEEEVDIVHNVNRLKPDGDEARTVDDALKVLSVEEKPDRHTEKRVKASYNAFEEKRLPILKAENPGLRMSQLKQMVFKEFEKSPDNPKNQAHVQYNYKPQKSIPELNDDSN